MALNKFMHPRNIYKTPPNFKQLALDYPEFRKYTKQDVTGKISIDFKDPKALQVLSTTLLKKDFHLDVDIPLTKMIPTIPLRLNYILWIEDLLSISNSDSAIRGIDIGTGASCIYPLIASKKNGWMMTATDVDADSVKQAEQNVEKNSLAFLIEVKTVNNTSILNESIGQDGTFDFSMCNPPFFASAHELNPLYKARRPDRPRPRNAFCATSTEVIAEGGEVNFISRMISESKDINKRVKIYTTMVGHKSSLPALKVQLREAGVVSFKQTEFCQGHTTRWALAWTYHDIDLRTVPGATVAVAKKCKPFQHIIEDTSTSLTELASKVTPIFDSLQFNYNIIKETKTCICYSITSSSNTWSHQRRKRREQERLNSVLVDDNNKAYPTIDEINDDILDASALVADLKVYSPKSPKREIDDSGFYRCKKPKIDNSNEVYLKYMFIIRKSDLNVVFELLFEEGTAGKDGLHQILQYVKNNLSLKKL